MKITTWNVRQWWWNRLEEIYNTILEDKSDIIIITEYRKNKEPLFSKKLHWLWYTSIFYTHSDNNQNSVLIASKLESKLIKSHLNNIIEVEINNIKLIGVYFPQSYAKQWTFEYILWLLERNNKNTILIWDFNTWKHYIDEEWKTFIHSNYLNKIEEYWLFDARRNWNNNKKEFSRYSNVWNWFRLDQCYISKDLIHQIISCNYNHLPRIEKISDHSLMSLSINI